MRELALAVRKYPFLQCCHHVVLVLAASRSKKLLLNRLDLRNRQDSNLINRMIDLFELQFRRSVLQVS